MNGLCFEPARAVRTLKRADPELAALIKDLGPFTMKIEPGGSTFTSLAEAIVYQQLSPKAAGTIHQRFCALFGEPCAPSPELVMEMTIDQLRAVGLSRAKAMAISDLADRTLQGEVPALEDTAELSDEELVTCLSAVRGVGRWTAEMFLIFRLGRPDVLPLADYGLRRGFGHAFLGGRLPAPPEVAARGERWRPFRTVASWYMWRAADSAALG